MNKITGTAYRLVTNIRMAFRYIDEEMLRKLNESLIRPPMEYASVVWSPHLKKYIDKLEERIRRAAIKTAPYEERLHKLDLQTLEERWRGDMITVYKHMRGMEKLD